MSTISTYSMTTEDVQGFADAVYFQTLRGLNHVGLLDNKNYEVARTQYAVLAMTSKGWRRVLEILGLLDEEPVGQTTFTVKLVKVKLW